MSPAWPALDAALAGMRAGPSRTGSVIVTVYGDAILPRGGALALADLLVLMGRLGASEGVVRTAVSRLTRDGLLVGRKVGRRSAYALTERGRAEFSAAVPAIYGPLNAAWDGRLTLVFPGPESDRGALDAGGFVLMAPGVLMSYRGAPAGEMWLEAEGMPETKRTLAAKGWPVAETGALYARFVAEFSGLCGAEAPTALDAIAARTALIHAWRRIALRDPRLPAGLLPVEWPGRVARTLCMAAYSGLAAASEAWLDEASDGSGPLPRGPDPVARFSGGGR